MSLKCHTSKFWGLPPKVVLMALFLPNDQRQLFSELEDLLLLLIIIITKHVSRVSFKKPRHASLVPRPSMT